MTKKQRKHAEVIIAWANGEEIEFCRPKETTWQPAPDPAFIEDYLYRVKPARSYPETLMADGDLERSYPVNSRFVLALRCAANAAIRHAIDNGQVVTREEFALAIGDTDKRDMAVAIAIGTVVEREVRRVQHEGGLYKWDFAEIIAEVKP